jgi:iron complex outermembrane recepter protein
MNTSRPGTCRRAILTLLACAAPTAFPLAASAQATPQPTASITGIVVDSSTSLPIAAVRVRLVEIRRNHVTHESGEFAFRLLPPGTHTVTFQRIGYRPQTRTVVITGSESHTLQVAMETAVMQLATTVVTGTLTERSSQEVLSPTSVLAGADLDRRLLGTVGATLQNEPGVSVTAMGPATARPVVRGLGGDRVLILEDGMRPGDLSSTSGDHAVAVDPLTATQFEVVRGPMSLLYGSSALGGVVNVIRDEIPTSVSEHPHGTLTLEGATVNRGLTAGGYSGTSIGRYSIRAEGSYRTAGDMQTPAGTLENTDLATYSVGAGLSRVTDNGHTGASYRFYDSRYGIPGGFVGGHADGVNIDMQRHTGRFELQRRLEGLTLDDLRATIGFTDYYHAERTSTGSVATLFGQRMASAEIVGRHSHAGPFSLGAIGVRAQFRDIETAGALRTPSTYDYTVAGFIVEEWESGPVHLQGGLRYDWARYAPREEGAFVEVGGEEIPALPRSFGSVSGSIGALYHSEAGFTTGASISRAYRTPDFNELYSDGPHLAAYSYDVGNPQLGEETGLGVDAFARLSRDRIRAEFAVFRNMMSGFVFPRNTGEIGRVGGRPKFQFVGRDAVLYGAEGDVELGLARHVALDITLSHVRGVLRGMPDSIPAIDDEPARAGSPNLPFMPPLNGNVTLRYDRSRHFFSLGTRFAGRQERLGDFETATAGYAVLDATAGIRLLVGSRFHTITLRGSNLGDIEHRQHLSRVKDVSPEAGRSISILYRLSF